MALNLQINKMYNFSLYAPAVLGASYRNAKLIGILDYTSALKIKNVEQLHRQVYPYLPAGVVNNPKTYTYYHFKYEKSGNYYDLVIANPWFIESSVVEVTSINLSILVNNVSLNDIEIIRSQLRLLGYNFTLDIV
jgi:hypothetical protein